MVEERKESENKIQPTSVLSTTEHVCDPSREAKAGRWPQVQGQLDRDALSQSPYPEKSSMCGGGGGGVSQEPFVPVSVVLICFSFFLPARRFTDKERNLLCAMAMTPDKGVMMRF